jgi:hypothetical protein
MEERDELEPEQPVAEAQPEDMEAPADDTEQVKGGMAKQEMIDQLRSRAPFSS